MQPERNLDQSVELRPSSDTSGVCRNPDVPEAHLRIERRVDGKLWSVRGDRAVVVKIVRCFPWSAPTRYLSLRSEADEEVALLRDVEELDPASRGVLLESLVAAGFVLDVLRVDEVEEDFEIRCWKVQTRQGPRTFQTSRDTWPQKTPNGELLLQDVAGDLFRIPPSDRLDVKSKKLLWAFVD
jgi:hypothetical protein